MYPYRKVRIDTRDWQNGPREGAERKLATVSPSGSRGASTPSYLVLSALRLSGQPQLLPPVRQPVRTLSGQEKATLSFERTCAGCRDVRAARDSQHCERCGKVTETILRWMESRLCVRCGCDTRMVEPLCDRCRRQMVTAYYRERAENRAGQLRLY